MTHQHYEQQFRSRPSWRAFAALLAVVVLSLPTTASAQHKLATGDTLNLTVYGQKELDRRITVDGAGMIWVPGIGQMQVANLTPQELRARLSGLLTRNAAISDNDIGLDVVSYRPIYVDGAISKPGSYPFTIGLTVRQAVALAGGYARPSLGQEELSTTLVDLKAEHRRLWSQYLQHHARASRLRAELENKAEFNWTPPVPGLLAPETVPHEATRLQNEQFKARVSAFERKKQYLDESIELTGEELAYLEVQRKRAESENEVVAKTLADLQRMAQKGVVTLNRLAEDQRAAAVFRDRLDNTKVQVVRVKRSRQELIEQRDQLVLARSDELTRDLQSTNSEMEAVEARLVGIVNRLVRADPTLARACAKLGDVNIMVHRQEQGHIKMLRVDEDASVWPGDVIEVNNINGDANAKCAFKNVGDVSSSTTKKE